MAKSIGKDCFWNSDACVPGHNAACDMCLDEQGVSPVPHISGAEQMPLETRAALVNALKFAALNITERRN